MSSDAMKREVSLFAKLIFGERAGMWRHHGPGAPSESGRGAGASVDAPADNAASDGNNGARGTAENA